MAVIIRSCLWFALLLLHLSATGQKNSDREINITVKPLANCFVYLGSYYGNTKIYADTAWINENGMGTFHGTKPLTSGLYFIISPSNAILFEFLLDTNRRFSIVTDTNALNNRVFIGSEINSRFKKYIDGAGDFGSKKLMLTMSFASAKTTEDTVRIRKDMMLIDKKIKEYADREIERDSESLLSLILLSGQIPQIPQGIVLKTKADSISLWYMMKKQFWKGIQFNDDRLLYTPGFDLKMDEYFRSYVIPVADSIIKDMDYILLYARSGKEIYSYLLLKFTNIYYNPPQIGQNKVFLDLFENFYLKGDTILLNPQSKKMIFERAYSLMANRLGDPAPPLDLTQINGTPISLYSVAAPYTFVVFWDPSCSHCQQYVPQIDSIYKAKWNKLGLKVFSVNINTALNKEMTDFIQNKKLSLDWIFAYQADTAAKAIAASGKLNYHQLYDVYETPTMYLLDEHKRIIAKGLSLQQFDAVLDARAKK